MDYGEDVQLRQSVLDKKYNRRSQVERTNESIKHCGLRTPRARGCVHAQTLAFFALCLRLVVTITNYEAETTQEARSSWYKFDYMTFSLEATTGRDESARQTGIRCRYLTRRAA
jgi:hypothetical protein